MPNSEAGAFAAALLYATAFAPEATDLTQLNSDDCANVQVTSASRK